MSPSPSGPSLPWWRIPMVWLVVGGPAVVVVASFVTLYVAMRGSDAVLPPDAPVAPAPAPTAAAPAGHYATPALQARNHANSPRP